MFSQLPDFKAWFPEVDGFPRPDWKAIREWIRLNVAADHLETAWQEIARVWLEKICQRLGGSYSIVESKDFLLLSERDSKQQQDLLSFLELARARVLRTLAEIPLPKRYGKHVVLCFTSDEDYYRYISYFDSDGAYASSSGRFLSPGYMHIAYPHDESRGTDHAVLAHELTHNLLKSFPLPLWLNEALAMLFEHELAGGRKRLVTRELAAEHRAYWNNLTIQEFWRGLSFSRPDGQNLAYGLAAILLDFIITDLKPSPPDFRDFVLHANRKGAGEAAARNYLGVELSDLVSAFLGLGEWAPRLT